MKGVEGMDSSHTTSTKELNCKTISATVRALVAAEFTSAISEYSSAFESDEFFKKKLTFGPPEQERIVLVGINLKAQQRVKRTYQCHIVRPRNIFGNPVLRVFLVKNFWVKVETGWVNQMSWRLANGVDDCGDTCSITFRVLGDGGGFVLEDARVNLGKGLVLDFAFPHEG